MNHAFWACFSKSRALDEINTTVQAALAHSATQLEETRAKLTQQGEELQRAQREVCHAAAKLAYSARRLVPSVPHAVGRGTLMLAGGGLAGDCTVSGLSQHLVACNRDSSGRQASCITAVQKLVQAQQSVLCGSLQPALQCKWKSWINLPTHSGLLCVSLTLAF